MSTQTTARFEITITKGDDGLQTAGVRIREVPQAGVIVEARGIDGAFAERQAKIKTLDYLMALAEAGEDLPPEVDALFTLRIL